MALDGGPTSFDLERGGGLRGGPGLPPAQVAGTPPIFPPHPIPNPAATPYPGKSPTS